MAVGAQIASLGTDKAGEATAVQGEGEAVGEGDLGMPVAGAVVVPIGLEHGLRIGHGGIGEREARVQGEVVAGANFGPPPWGDASATFGTEVEGSTPEGGGRHDVLEVHRGEVGQQTGKARDGFVLRGRNAIVERGIPAVGLVALLEGELRVVAARDVARCGIGGEHLLLAVFVGKALSVFGPKVEGMDGARGAQAMPGGGSVAIGHISTRRGLGLSPDVFGGAGDAQRGHAPMAVGVASVGSFCAQLMVHPLALIARVGTG